MEFSFYYEPGDVFFSTANEAAEYFTNQGMNPHILPSGSIVTMDYDSSRVRIYHDKENSSKILSIDIG